MRTRQNPFGFRIDLGDLLLIAGGIYVLTNNRFNFLLNTLLPPPPAGGVPLPVGGPGGVVSGGVAVPARPVFSIVNAAVSPTFAHQDRPLSLTIDVYHTGPANDYVAGVVLRTQVGTIAKLFNLEHGVDVQTIETGFSVAADPTATLYHPATQATLHVDESLLPGILRLRLISYLDTHFYIRDQAGRELAGSDGFLTIGIL